MSVFTIYCHGTGGHRDKPDKEIVAYFGRRAAGTEYQDYLILDGVAGAPKNKEGKNPMAGTFNWADKNKAAKGDTPLELGGGKVKGKLAASASGFGVDDNTRHAIVTIANLRELPETVNLIGWSRGAVTCLTIANMLYDPSTTEGLFRQIKVNIFAVDPVAGAEAGHGKDAENKRLIPPTVKNYLGILAKGENRETFKPQDLSRVQIPDPGQSNVVFLPFPGKHSTVAQNCDDKALEVSDIVWSMAHQFLSTFGSNVAKPRVICSLIDYVVNYTRIVAKAADYAKIKQKGLFQRAIGMGFGTRSFTKELHKYTVNPEYFVNAHHHMAFKLALPALYSWLFTMGSFKAGGDSTKVNDSHPVGGELALMDRVCPEFVTSLGVYGVSGSGGQFTLPPRGAAFDAKSAASAQGGDLLRMGVLI
jgi:uncharacterized protein DUF5621